MHPLLALLLVVGLIAATTVVGLLWRTRQGSLHVVTDAGAPLPLAPRLDGATAAHPLTPADLGSSAPFGSRATLVQFSTEFCARCPATRRLLGEVASTREGVVHLDIDLTHRADLANRFRIFQTPTTLVLGSDGALTARINGLPLRDSVTEHLDALTGRHSEGNNHVNTPL